MSYDEQIRAALEAEAARAQVPAREILHRVKQSGVRVRRPYLLQMGGLIRTAAVVATVGALVATAFWGGSLVGKRTAGQVATGPAGTGSQPAAVPEAASGPVTAYESHNLGFRVTFPTQFIGPDKDERGALVFNADNVIFTVERRPRPQGQVIEDLLGDLVAENLKESRRLKPTDLGIGLMGGRDVAHIHTAYISAAGWFERETYGFLTGEHQYVITCGGRPGEQTAWAVVGPICGQVMEGLEIGTDLGFIGVKQAVEAARTAVPGELEVTMVLLEERFNVQGVGVQPVWRVHVIAQGEQQTEYEVIIDARSGKVLYVQNVATGERKTP
ncbi:MAG: hypothetical protein K0R39_3854 [Symbiobacteriaceae bacterium]|nr:hypothetical protein [Symbiobacteriaceae bacterium]